MVGGVYLQAFDDVRRHFASIKPKRGVLCELVVMRLLAASPEFRAYATGHEHAIAKELERVLRVVVHNSRDIGQWWALMGELGERLGAKGVVPEALSSFAGVFSGALLDAVPATPRQALAWELFVRSAWGAMTPGMIKRPRRLNAAAA